MNTPRHPMQPLVRDSKGKIRFRENKIVIWLLDKGPFDMNDLARMGPDFSDEDREQFAQLIGYSVSGFSELSYVSDEAYQEASRAADQLPRTMPNSFLTLTEFQWHLLSLATLSTIGFGDQTQGDREALESQGLIEAVDTNTYKATPAGITASNARGQ